MVLDDVLDLVDDVILAPRPGADLQQVRVEELFLGLGVHLEEDAQPVPHRRQRLRVRAVDVVEVGEQAALLGMVVKDELGDVHGASKNRDGWAASVWRAHCGSPVERRCGPVVQRQGDAEHPAAGGAPAGVSFDPDLAERLRAAVAAETGVTEKRMFGGLAFLVNGNMAVSASGEGGLLLQVDPGASAQLAGRPHAEVAVMRGREMPGWLRVSAAGVSTKRDLERWAAVGVAYARSLPPKG